MPFLNIQTSCAVSRKQETELKSCIGKAISLIPGKSEAYLLLSFRDNCRLWLGGSDKEPIAYIEAAIFANEGHFGYPAFTAAVTQAFCDVLGIAPKRVYLKFEDIAAWSVGGHYIDRKMFG